MTWNGEIVEGYAADLAKALQRWTDDQWEIHAVLTNGINRWTIIVKRLEGESK